MTVVNCAVTLVPAEKTEIYMIGGQWEPLETRRSDTCSCLSSLTISVRKSQKLSALLLIDRCHRRIGTVAEARDEGSSRLRAGKAMWQGVSIHPFGMQIHGVLRPCLKDRWLYVYQAPKCHFMQTQRLLRRSHA